MRNHFLLSFNIAIGVYVQRNGIFIEVRQNIGIYCNDLLWVPTVLIYNNTERFLNIVSCSIPDILVRIYVLAIPLVVEPLLSVGANKKMYACA